MDMHETPDMVTAQKRVVEDIKRMTLQHCPECNHRWFDVDLEDKLKICRSCIASQKNHGGVSDFGSDNDMDPRLDEVVHLPKLSAIEEMLISPIISIMSAYRLEGGRLAYKGNVINFKQDGVEFSRSLPRRVGELPVVIVRRRNSRSPNTFSEFRVRREAVREWLDFLRDENPSFAALFAEDQMVMNASALDSLPEDEYVADQLKTIFEEEDWRS